MAASRQAVEGRRVIRYVTAKEIALLYGKSVNNVHQLAHVHRWRRCDGLRPALYSVDDVLDTLGTTLDTTIENPKTLKLGWDPS